MPHADSALVPAGLSRSQFWDHIYDQLSALLDGQRSWVTNLSNASSLIYNSLLAYEAFGEGSNAVNWCGFYIDSPLFPTPRVSHSTHAQDIPVQKLLLGPFCGKPACQFINTTPGKARGVCADAYVRREIVLVSDVETYPGHIACDGDTKSEIVCPLILRGDKEDITLGVLDLDCLALNGFTEEDKIGLAKIADLVVAACDW